MTIDLGEPTDPELRAQFAALRERDLAAQAFGRSGDEHGARRGHDRQFKGER